MPDTLREVGRRMAKSYKDIEQLKRRGGLLPAQERTRGNLSKKNSFIAKFEAPTESRRMYLKLAFYRQVL